MVNLQPNDVKLNSKKEFNQNKSDLMEIFKENVTLIGVGAT